MSVKNWYLKIRFRWQSDLEKTKKNYLLGDEDKDMQRHQQELKS